MSLRIWQKLFLGSGVVLTLALLAMTLLMGRSFQSGFVQYLNAWEAAEIAELKDKLTAAYQSHGDWSFLQLPPYEQRSQFGLSLGPPSPSASDRGPGRGPRSEPRPRGPRGAPPPGLGPRPGPERRGDAGPRRPQGDSQKPPPGRREVSGQTKKSQDKGSARRRGPQTGLLDISQRVAVVDGEGRHLAGPGEAAKAGIEHPLTANGTVVGSLRVLPVPSLRRDQDLEFARRQSRNAVVIGVLAMLCAALAILWVSRRLTSPLPRLTQGVHRLTQGHYDERVRINTGDELQQLGQDFNQLAQALARHRTQQQSWIAQISHELRTPLAVLTGEIHALIDGVRTVSPQALESLSQEADRLTHLVDDLFLLSVSEAGGSLFDHRSLNLCELLTDFCKEHPELGFDPENHKNAEIWGDPFRLRQLLTNLLQNSQRYSDPPATIALSLSSGPSHWHINWDDSPPGVPEDALENLFDPLFRVEGSRARTTGGAGLGLAIVKTIVTAHDGQIRAEASPLGGLRIVVSLPHQPSG